MKLLILVTALLSLLVTIDAVCPASNYKITSLPNFDLGTNPEFPCMYSGYIDIFGNNYSSGRFFWLFPSTNTQQLTSNIPLVIWLNGGPGSSSMVGLFAENGPLRFTKNSTGDLTLYYDEFVSWLPVAHVVFVDQPDDCGLSFINPGSQRATTEEQVGAEMLNFIQGFYQQFPWLSDNPLYITGESYGGKYIPNMCKTILDFNDRVDATQKIPLNGALIGNPYVDPIPQNVLIRTLTSAVGMISPEHLPQMEILENNCSWATVNTPENGDPVCENILDFVSVVSGGVNNYDIRIFDFEDDPQEGFFDDYINKSPYRDAVVQAIHVNTSSLRTNSDGNTSYWLPYNEAIYNALLNDSSLQAVDVYSNLLNRDFPLVVYVGQFDLVCGVNGVQAWIEKLTWIHTEEFLKSPQMIYMVNKTAKGQTVTVPAGYYKTYKNMNYLIVHGAGHLVPTTQIQASLSFLKDFTTRQPTADPEGFAYSLHCYNPNGCTTFTEQCEFMNNCSNNGVCANGFCECNNFYYGGDCSIRPVNVNVTTYTDTRGFNLLPMQWTYFRKQVTSTLGSITLNVNFAVEFYANNKNILPSVDNYTYYANSKTITLQAADILTSTNSSSTVLFIGIRNPSDVKNATGTITFALPTVAPEAPELFWGPGNAGFIICMVWLSISIVLIGFSTFYFVRARKITTKVSRYERLDGVM